MDWCFFPQQGVQHRMVLVVSFFRILEIKLFCFVVAMSALVDAMESIHGLCLLLTASGNLFLNMSDAHETANCSFTAILIFQKRFPDAVSNSGR